MAVTVSQKYQVVIPEEIRVSLGIRAGSKIEVLSKGKVAYLVPVPELKELKELMTQKIDEKKIRDKKDRY